MYSLSSHGDGDILKYEMVEREERDVGTRVEQTAVLERLAVVPFQRMYCVEMECNIKVGCGCSVEVTQPSADRQYIKAE